VTTRQTAAIRANTPRYPRLPPSRLPAGTPSTRAKVSPPNTTATARPLSSGGRKVVANNVAAGVYAAAPSAATIRPTIRIG
jgi:hypothetical protein